MKASKKYFGILQVPSKENAREAARIVRGLGGKFLVTHGNVAVQLLADDRQAEALRRTGIFASLTASAVKREHMKELPEATRGAAAAWNAGFTAAFRKSKREGRKLRGKSWADEGRREPAPHSAIDHHRLQDVLAAHAERLGVKVPTRRGQPWVRTIRAEEYRKVVGHLTAVLRDETLAYHLARAVVKLTPWAYEVMKRLSPDELREASDEPRHPEDTCWKMTGRMSVGIIFVDSEQREGPRFSSSDRAAIEREIVDGLSWLASEHPANDLSWEIHTFHERINVANGGEDDSDAYFTLPAIGGITFNGNTYAASSAGRNELREDLRNADDADHALLIFVTTFNVDGVLFAFPTLHYVVLSQQDDWKEWGRSALDGITVHEVCHLFGAPDEYTSKSGTPCTACEGTFGCDKIPNGNCGECARPQQQCAMEGNALRLCEYTKGQIGWSHLFVELFTDDEWLSGTDDDVEIDIGQRTYELETDNHNDRENNNREGYAIWDPSLTLSDIRRVLIRKSSDGLFGGWKLRQVRVHFAGAVVCDEVVNEWIENETHLFRLVCAFTDRDPDLVNTLSVRVTTGDVWLGGTDDDVSFKAAGHTWQLDSTADDFERGSTRTYSLDPRTALHVPDISTVTISKSSDGLFGGWRLGGIRVTVNGDVIYDNASINRWLEDDSRIFTDSV